MRNISSAVLSLAAMALSSLTTYLSFFDARYTLTAAVADVDGQTQRGSSSGNGRWSVDFISNRLAAEASWRRASPCARLYAAV